MADTPNMNLPIPTVGPNGTVGPDWANRNNACFQAIDSHDHSVGKGVPITPAGLNINSDLPLNGNNLTDAKSLGMTDLLAALTSIIKSLQCVGGELYYIDGAGNAVQITLNGSVTGSSGTITGLPSGTASASFAAGAFTFNSATNTPATMNVGPLVIGEQTASPNKITLQSPTALGAAYTFTLPPAQGASGSILSNNGSGSTSFVVPDGITFGLNGGVYKVLDGGINTAQLANLAVTNAKLAAVNAASSAISGTVTISSTGGFVAVTGLTGTITGVGRPVMVMVTPSANSISGGTPSTIRSTSGCQLTLQLRRGGTPIQELQMSCISGEVQNPTVTFIDPSPSAGSLQYDLYARVSANDARFINVGFSVLEL